MNVGEYGKNSICNVEIIYQSVQILEDLLIINCLNVIIIRIDSTCLPSLTHNTFALNVKCVIIFIILMNFLISFY